MRRQQLPVHSPLPLGALVGGLAAAGGRNGDAAGRVLDHLTGRFGPVGVLRTDSGTSALALALAAVARGRPDAPVALPAYCCYDVATAAVAAELPVVLYDLDPRTLGPDPDSLGDALDRDVSAVVVAPLYGIPVDMAAVDRLVEGSATIVIEDAAQGAGATYRGRPIGSFGSLSVLSFGRGKGVTGAGGGALLAHDERGLALLERAEERIRPARSGWRDGVTGLALWGLARPSVYGIPAALPFLGLGETVYRPPRPARRQSTFSTGVLARTFELEAADVRRRRERAARLLRVVEDGRGPSDGQGLVPIRGPEDGDPAYLRLPVLAPEGRRDELLTTSARRLGVMPGYPRPLSTLEALRGRLVDEGRELPGAEALSERLLTVPTHGRLSGRDERRLVEWVGEIAVGSGGREDRIDRHARRVTSGKVPGEDTSLSAP